MQKLDPKAKWLFFWNSTGFLFLVLIADIFVVISYMVNSNFRKSIGGDSNFIMILIIGTISISAFIVIFYHLVFKSYGYRLDEYELKIEKGVINKRYISIPYNKIQNIDIKRKVFARMLGLSELQIQTAGYGATMGSEGGLPGLSQEKAEQIKGELISRMNQGRRFQNNSNSLR